jgi:hypothetical protein
MRMIPRGHSMLLYQPTQVRAGKGASCSTFSLAAVFGHPFNPSGQSDQPFQSFNPFNNKYVFVLFISP